MPKTHNLEFISKQKKNVTYETSMKVRNCVRNHTEKKYMTT